jgi:hypothetical protein
MKELEMKKLVVSLFCLSAVMFLYSPSLMAQSGRPPAPCCPYFQNRPAPAEDSMPMFREIGVSQTAALLTQSSDLMNHLSPVFSSNQTVGQSFVNTLLLLVMPLGQLDSSMPVEETDGQLHVAAQTVKPLYYSDRGSSSTTVP